MESAGSVIERTQHMNGGLPIVTMKVDVTKLDKDRFFHSLKTGAKYCNLVLIPSPNNEYGDDWLVKESASKEEREAGIDLPILGNARTLKASSGHVELKESEPTESKDDVPF